MSSITTHVLDTSSGRPAGGVPVVLETRSDGGEWKLLGRAATDADGRVKSFPSPQGAGVYRLRFDTSALTPFYPEVTVVFVIADLAQHHHIPLLLSPYGYSTYLGS